MTFATNDELNESNREHAVNYMSIMLALLEKEIITPEELRKAQSLDKGMVATHMAETALEKKKREATT